MFNLGKFVKVVENRINRILIEDEKCCKNRSVLSKCRLCEDICPNNSISVKKKKVSLKEHCLSCGLCASVCPTTAISIQEPTEIGLYNKIQKIGCNQGTVVVGCSLNNNLPSKVITVPCLGGLSLAFLLYINSADFPVYVIYNEDLCKGCLVTNGLKVYLERIEKIKQIHAELGISINRIQNNKLPDKIQSPKIDNSEVDYDRRKFFNLMFDQIKKVPDTVVKELLDTTEEKSREVKSVSQKMISHMKLLQIYFNNVNIIVSENKEIKFFYRPYLIDKCQFCRACAILCPVGALRYKEDENTIVLMEGLCTGCGTCVDVCYYKALELGPQKVDTFNKNEETLFIQKT